MPAVGEEPALRYPTAQTMAEDLGRFLNGEPVQARPLSPAEQAWRWCRRTPALVILSATAAALLSLKSFSQSAPVNFTWAPDGQAVAVKSDHAVTRLDLDTGKQTENSPLAAG